jgi:NAD+ diphosphatase
MTDLFGDLPRGPVAGLGFGANGCERAAHLRDDVEWQNSTQLSGEARFILLCRDVPLLDLEGAKPRARFTLAEAASLQAMASTTLFLGLDGETPLFARALPADHFDDIKTAGRYKLIDMRSIAMQDLFSPAETALLGTAKAMGHWHQRHGFCSACGKPSTVASSGWKRSCTSCGAEHFPRTDPVVIMLAIRGDRCLMGRAPAFPEGRYSCLAGFMEPCETIEDAVRREIAEEAGISVGRVRIMMAQPWPFPSSLMIGCLAEATSDNIKIDPNELADARWFTRDEVAAVLAGTHPEGMTAPPPMAIANHIMRLFVETKA